MGNACANPVHVDAQEFETRQITNLASAEPNTATPAELKAFRNQWECIPAKAGEIYGEQGKPVEYIYMRLHEPSNGTGSFWRVWNEPEKAWLLTPNGAAEAPPMKGFGLYPASEPLSASLQEMCDRGSDVSHADLSSPNPIYTYTMLLPTSLGAQRADPYDCARIGRWNWKLHWSSTPPSIQAALLTNMQRYLKSFEKQRDAYDMRRIVKGVGEINQSETEEYKPLRQALAASFRAQQAAMGLSHWGPLVFAIVDSEGDKIEDPSTREFIKRRGQVLVGCRNAQGPYAEFILALEFDFESPYDKASDRYVDPRIVGLTRKPPTDIPMRVVKRVDPSKVPHDYE